MAHQPTVAEESDASYPQDVRPPLLTLWHFQVLTRTTYKEEGAHRKLSRRALRLRRLVFEELGYDREGDGFLLLLVGVYIFEAASLPR